MRVNSKKIGLVCAVSIIVIITLAVSSVYFKLEMLDIFVRDKGGHAISKSDVVYHFDGELTSKYSGGELEVEKIIGRVEGVSLAETFFTGPKICKLKGYDEKDVVLVRGLMLQEVLRRKEK